MRPHQWVKNIALFAGIIFDRQLNNPAGFLQVILGVLIFSLLSSSVYMINDIADIEADRSHPKKKKRPIASGKLSIRAAVITAVLLIIICIPSAFMLGIGFGIISSIYLIQNLLYSNWLKHVPIIDVLILSAGFVLRVAAGVSLIEVERFSPWLYVVTTLMALLLGFGKRKGELLQLNDSATEHRRVLGGYTLPLLDQLITIVTSTTIMSYSLYTFSAPNVPENHSMMLTIPFVLYGFFRYLYIIQVNKEGGDPTEILIKDRPLQITVVLWGFAVLLIFYIL